MQTGLERVGGEEPLAEGVDGRHHQSVALFRQRLGSPFHFPGRFRYQTRLGVPAHRFRPGGEFEERNADLARHLGGRRLGEGDGHHPLDHPARGRAVVEFGLA